MTFKPFIYWALAFFLLVFAPNAWATITTYNFQADTIGATPLDVTYTDWSTSGVSATLQVVDDVDLGKSFSISGDKNRIDAVFDNISSSSCQDTSFVLNDITNNGGSKSGVVVFSNSDNRQGYLVQWDDTVDNRIEIFRRSILSPYGHSLLASTSSFPSTTDNKWRVTADGSSGTTTITIHSWDGSSWVEELSTTDSTYTSGGFGASRVLGGVVSSPMLIDDIVSDDNGIFCNPSLNTISITNLSDFQTFQRDNVGRFDIPVSGTYTGTCSSIEASWNGGAYETIVTSPSGGTFSGTINGQNTGQGTLVARCTNDTTANDSVDDIGIGDVFLIAGQSNAEGRANNTQSYSHPSLKAVAFNEADNWINGNDPIDTGSGAGSPWPLLATHIMDSQNVPVAFITTASGGTGLVNPADWDITTGPEYANFVNQVNDSGVNAFKAVLWHQGESDINNSVSRAAYNSALDNLANQILMDVPGNPPLIVAQIGDKVTGSPTREDLDAVRLAQSDAWDDNPLIFAGPSLYDIGPLSDGVHLRTDIEIQTLANRWWASVEEALYGGTTGRGAKIDYAMEDASRSNIQVHFLDVHDTLLPTGSITGFYVTEDGTPVSISSVNRVDSDTIEVGLSSPLTGGTVEISYGSGNDRGNLTDNSTFNLPVEMFANHPVLTLDVTPPASPSCVTSPSPSSDGTDVTTTCSGVETGASIYIPHMICSSEVGGIITCTGTVGTGGITVSNDVVTITDSFGNSDNSSRTGLVIENNSETSSSSSSSKGSSRRYVCKDPQATNYSDSKFASGKSSLCKYEKIKTITETLNSGKCSNNLIISQNLKTGARDGKYNGYAKSTVTQVALLQYHINRILASKYDNASGEVDGIFGPLTKLGVQRLQETLNTSVTPSPNLIIDGIVGPYTKEAINSSCG